MRLLVTLSLTLLGAAALDQVQSSESPAPKAGLVTGASTECVAMHKPGESKIECESYHIPSSDAGIQLYVRNKHVAGMTRFSAARTVIFVHGTTQASESAFDLPLDGLSWMDSLAAHGYDVYLVDLRGYGGSSRPPEMNQPAADNPPIVRTDTAIKDLGTAIDHVLAHRELHSLSIIGWSWGATIAGAYTAEHNDKAIRLVLYAPQWVREGTIGGPGALGAYQTWTVQQARDRLQTGTPEGKKDELFPPAWFRQWSAAALATDPVGSTLNPPVVRTPNGSPQDMRDYWFAGKPYWDPSRVTAPTLVVRGEWDGVSTISEALGLFNVLSNARLKRMVLIGAGSHMMLIEKNREQLFREVQLFLDEATPPSN
jgi:pimeloyl-ACP methyl ester carboxylesterase